MATRHQVQPGECISTISDKYSQRVESLWDADENADLRKARRTGYTLKPGDVVVVPDLDDKKTVGGKGTGKTHPFRVKGPAEKLRLKLLDGHQPRAGLGFTLDIEGRMVDGQTNGEGLLEAWLDPADRKGRLYLDGGEELELDIGALLPVDEPEGARQRLTNLGYLEPEGATDEDVVRAVRFFQEHQKLPVTGALDAATQDKLTELHGC